MGGASWVADFQDIISVIVSLMGFFFCFFFASQSRAAPSAAHLCKQSTDRGDKAEDENGSAAGFSAQLLSRPHSADSEGLGFNADLTGVFV